MAVIQQLIELLLLLNLETRVWSCVFKERGLATLRHLEA